MMRLRLVIADRDKAYGESLMGFLTDKYPQKFKVSFFTDENHLAEFLLKGGEKGDILLISPEFYEKLESCCHELNGNYQNLNTNNHEYSTNCQGFGAGSRDFNANCHEFNTNSHGSNDDYCKLNAGGYKERIPVVILLAGNDAPCKPCAFDTICKYQHGDKIVSDIIGIYESRCGNSGLSLKHAGYAEKEEPGEMSKTWLISVYSPTGGAGKTTIAINSCIQCAREGMKVLYLNFESISSEPCFFECNFSDATRHSFSGIILAAKEKDKNLHAKIESMKLIDAVHNIYYFIPPDSALEMDEILPDETRYLLQQIILTGYYDIVFADMDSSLSARNLAVMEESDNVILVHTPGLVSRRKILSFCRELGIYNQMKGVNLQDKMVLAVNRYDENTLEEIMNDIEVICTTMGIDRYFKIPASVQAASCRDERLGLYGSGRAGESDGFNRELRKLVGKYVKGKHDYAKSCRAY